MGVNISINDNFDNWIKNQKLIDSGFINNYSNGENEFSFTGINGWELLYLNLPELVKAPFIKYRFSFDYYSPSGCTKGDNDLKFLITSNTPGESNYSSWNNILASSNIMNLEAANDYTTYSFTFSINSRISQTIYSVLNLGVLTNGVNYTLKFRNIKLEIIPNETWYQTNNIPYLFDEKPTGLLLKTYLNSLNTTLEFKEVFNIDKVWRILSSELDNRLMTNEYNDNLELKDVFNMDRIWNTSNNTLNNILMTNEYDDDIYIVELFNIDRIWENIDGILTNPYIIDYDDNVYIVELFNQNRIWCDENQTVWNPNIIDYDDNLYIVELFNQNRLWEKNGETMWNPYIIEYDTDLYQVELFNHDRIWIYKEDEEEKCHNPLAVLVWTDLYTVDLFNINRIWTMGYDFYGDDIVYNEKLLDINKTIDPAAFEKPCSIWCWYLDADYRDYSKILMTSTDMPEILGAFGHTDSLRIAKINNNEVNKIGPMVFRYSGIDEFHVPSIVNEKLKYSDHVFPKKPFKDPPEIIIDDIID